MPGDDFGATKGLVFFFFPWRKLNSWNWGSSSKSHFYLCSSRCVLLCLVLLLLECIKGRCTVHSARCLSSEKWRTAKVSLHQEWAGGFLSEGLLHVRVEVWMWKVLGLNTPGRGRCMISDSNAAGFITGDSSSPAAVEVFLLGHSIAIMGRSRKHRCVQLWERYKAQCNCPCCSLARMLGLTLPPLSRNA